MADAFPTMALFEAAAEVPGDAEVVGVPVFADATLPEGALAGQGGFAIDHGFLARCGFEGRVGQSQAIPAGGGRAVVAIGVGNRPSVDADALRRAGAALAPYLSHSAVAATTVSSAANRGAMAAAIVEGIALGGYRYAGSPKPPALGPGRVVVVGASPQDVRFGSVAALATIRARDWVNEPAGTLTPSALGAVAVELGARYGFGVEVWDAERIATERLGGLEGVSKGADEPARLIRLSYEPEGAVRTIALVGKGITFDSGGLSIKPAAAMMTMKTDMGGAAAVISAVAAAAELSLPVAVTGWVASTENMVGGHATRPGDVLTIRGGTTVEVLNTDAEGRLILADALVLAVEESPDFIVDIATLTGAQGVALGAEVAAVMGNDDAWVAAVIAAGERAGEPAWRLPLVSAYRSKLDSDVADLKNVSSGSGAGSIIAALFLAEFVAGLPWAHLDIASPSRAESDDGWLTKGATGWGARTLLQLLAGL